MHPAEVVYDSDKTNLKVIFFINYFFYTFAEFSAIYVDLGLLEKILDNPNKNIVVCGGYMHCDDVIEYLKLLGGSVKQVDMFNKRMIEDENYAMSQLEGLLK